MTGKHWHSARQRRAFFVTKGFKRKPKQRKIRVTAHRRKGRYVKSYLRRK